MPCWRLICHIYNSKSPSHDYQHFRFDVVLKCSVFAWLILNLKIAYQFPAIFIVTKLCTIECCWLIVTNYHWLGIHAIAIKSTTLTNSQLHTLVNTCHWVMGTREVIADIGCPNPCDDLCIINRPRHYMTKPFSVNSFHNVIYPWNIYMSIDL